MGLWRRLVERIRERDLKSLVGPMHSSDRLTRADACSKLGKHKDTRGVSILIATIQDKSEDGEIRYSAAVGLGLSANARALEPLLAALNDSNGYVRQGAVAGLHCLGDPRAIAPLRALHDRDEDVQKAVQYSLRKLERNAGEIRRR